MLFKYKAIENTGQKTEGQIEAVTIDVAIDALQKRGLIIAQHHAIPLGLNVARWPKDVPYNYTEHPETR